MTPIYMLIPALKHTFHYVLKPTFSPDKTNFLLSTGFFRGEEGWIFFWGGEGAVKNCFFTAEKKLLGGPFL